MADNRSVEGDQAQADHGLSLSEITDYGLAIGASFDVFTPVYRIARGVVEGPHHDYAIYEGGGFTGRDIDMLLASYGVRHFGMWGIGAPNEYTICVKVPLNHCTKAEWVFRRHGIRIYNPCQQRATTRPLRTWREFVEQG